MPTTTLRREPVVKMPLTDAVITAAQGQTRLTRAIDLLIHAAAAAPTGHPAVDQQREAIHSIVTAMCEAIWVCSMEHAAAVITARSLSHADAPILANEAQKCAAAIRKLGGIDT